MSGEIMGYSRGFKPALIILVALGMTLWGCKQKYSGTARIQTLMKRAEDEGNQALFMEAKRLLDQAIAKNPRDSSLYGTLATFYVKINQPGEALKSYHKGLKLAPDDLSIHLKVGFIYVGMAQPAKAKPHFQKVMRSKLTQSNEGFIQQALQGLAFVAEEYGQFDKAEQYYLKAMAIGHQLAPHSCTTQSLGPLYAGLGKFKTKARWALHVAPMAPHRVDIQFRVAVISFLAYDFPNVRKHCRHVLKQSPNKPGKCSNMLGLLLLLEQKYEKAAKTFNKVLKENPLDAGAQVGKGHLAIIKKDYKGALPLLKPHTLSRPPDSDQPSYPLVIFKMANLGMGWLLSNQGQHAQAIKYFDNILSIHKVDLFALLGKGNALNALGQLNQAEAAFKKVLEVHPANQYGLAELGLVRLNRGDMEGAKEAFKKAQAQGNQKYTCPYEGLGLVLLKQGKIAGAKENFEKAIAINPDIEYKKFNELAKILIKQGKTDRAMKLLKKSIQNYPYDPEAKELLRMLSINLHAPND